MKLILLVSSSLALFACSFIGFAIPWVKPKITIKQGLFEVSVPIELGLLQCYSDICGNLMKIFEGKHHHKEQKSDEEQSQGSEDSDALGFGFKDPRKKNFENVHEFNEKVVKKAIKPFQTASVGASLIMFRYSVPSTHILTLSCLILHIPPL